MTALVDVRRVKKYFPVGRWSAKRGKFIRDVDEITFSINDGETLAIVGESGCGKTTLSRLVGALARPTAGQVFFDGVDLETARGSALRRIRLQLQTVFQDPQSSLNPRMSVFDAVAYPMRVNGLHKKDRAARVDGLLQEVGLAPSIGKRFPHELSGGQRQRVVIARALSVSPRLLVLDEPVSALDLSAQARVLNLLRDIQASTGVAALLVTHDIAVAHYLSRRILVMYAGKVMELGAATDVVSAPLHPYTAGLLAAANVGERIQASTPVPEGEPPSQVDPPSGCRYRTRCRFAAAVCAAEEPPLAEIRSDWLAACHIPTGRLTPSDMSRAA